MPNESRETINNAEQNHIAPIRGSKQANLITIFTPPEWFHKKTKDQSRYLLDRTNYVIRGKPSKKKRMAYKGF